MSAVSDEETIAALRAEVQRLRQELAQRPAQQEEMEQFAFVASHDLKEPLRIVANYLGLLRRRYAKELGGSGNEYLNTALATTVRMRQLIDNLLEFSRVQELTAERLPLRVAVDTALENLAQLISDTQADIQIGELPELNIDRVQMTRLIQNLVANALKYRRDEPVRVSITARHVESGWQILIRDNGQGIAPAYQQKIFQMFSRLHARDDIEGSGIGLATCQRIAQRHGGSISVESTPGEGSCFCVELPEGAAMAKTGTGSG